MGGQEEGVATVASCCTAAIRCKSSLKWERVLSPLWLESVLSWQLNATEHISPLKHGLKGICDAIRGARSARF